MTTTTTTSGAADLPEALHRVIDDFERRERGIPQAHRGRGIPQAHIAAALATELRAALAAVQATSSQAGEHPALVCDYCGALTPDPWHSSGMLHGKMSKHIHPCDACASHGQAPAQADSVQEDAARYRFLRDGEWRGTDLEPFIRLQLNTLWDAKIDDACAAQEGGK